MMSLLAGMSGLPQPMQPIRLGQSHRERNGTGKCACGCGATISANKEFKYGHTATGRVVNKETEQGK
jgi:hypothetical protein